MIGCGCNGKGGSCVSGGGNGLLGQSCNCHQCAWQVVIGVGMAVVHFWKVGRLAGTLETDLWQQESGSSGCMSVACVAV